MTWEPDGEGNVAVLYPDGRRELHTKTGSTYAPPEGYFSTLAPDGAGGFTLTQKDRTTYALSADKRLTQITDSNGRSVSLAYDASGNLAAVTDDVSGRSLTLTWSGERIASVQTDSVAAHGGPLVWRYSYDADGRLAEACDPRDPTPGTGFCTTYAYDAGGLLSEIVRPRGNTEVSLTYNPDGLVATRADGEGNTWSFDYSTDHQVTTTDPRGHAATQHFDARFRLTKEVDPLGAATTYAYDAGGNRTKITDPLGQVSEMTYDASGNLTSSADPTGATAYFSYDTEDNLTVSRDPRSTSNTDPTFATTYGYDAQGNRTSETDPLGNQNTWSYTDGTKAAVGGGTMPPGLLRTETDPRGNVTTYSYDALGDLRRVEHPSGLLVTYAYDELGRRTSETTEDQVAGTTATLTTAYDPLGNPTALTHPAAANSLTGVTHQLRVRSTYDRNGNLTESVEEDLEGQDASRTTTYAYDQADRQTSVTDPEGGTLSRTYDASGNVATVTDPEGRVRVTAYDARNLPTSVTLKGFVDDPVGGSTPRDLTLAAYTYDAAGRRLTETDPLGRVRRYAYDGADRVTEVRLLDYRNPDGTTRDVVLEAYAYDPAGNVTTETRGDGTAGQLVVTHAYDPAGRRTKTTLDPGGLGRVTDFLYDASGNLLRRTTTDGTRTEEVRFAYDGADRVVSETTENGDDDLVVTYGYDQRGNLTEVTDPRGNVTGADPAAYTTSYVHDVLGRVITETGPPVEAEENGGTPATLRPTTTFGYDTWGNLTHRQDPRGNLTTQGFDRLSRRTEIRHPDYTTPDSTVVTATETFGYDRVGNLVSRTDRRGETTEFTFDALNRVVRRLDPQVAGEAARGEVRYAYDDRGNRTELVDQRGARTTWTYDDLDRARTETAVVRLPGGGEGHHTTTFDHDDLGNQVLRADPTGATWTSAYSAASELVSVTDPAGAVTSYAYDLASRVVRETDPLGRYTTHHYDPAGRRVATRRWSPTDVLLTEELFGYDPAGNRTSHTTPRGHETTFAYDALDRLRSVTQPVSSTASITTSYGYDAGGNHTRTTDGRGEVWVTTYQAWDLRESVVEPATAAHPDASQRTFTTIYDPGGLPTEVRLPGVTVPRSFDALGRLVSESGSGAGVASASRSFGYDLAGLRTSASHPQGTIGFAYDDRGLLTDVSGPAGAATYAYDPTGRLTERTDAAGTHAFAWTQRGELATATEPLTGITVSYGWDAAGQLTSVTYGGGSAPTRTFSYDDLGRVTSDVLRDPAGTEVAREDYGYDLDSNLTAASVTLPGNPAQGTNTYAYDHAGRLLTWIHGGTTTTYTWDGAGNRTGAGSATYAYDARNRLLSGPGTTYAWSARGTLTEVTDGFGTTAYGYDALGRLVEYGGTVPYTYDALDRVATRAGAAFAYEGTSWDPVTDGTFTFSRTPGGRLLALTDGTTPLLGGHNRHGDLTHLFTTAGAVTDTRLYDPFGKVIGTSGTTDPTLGFQGDFTDPASGHVWMGARWYEGSWAAFLSRDTVFGQLQTPVSLNRYTYAFADPLNYWDPDGRFAVPMIDGLCGTPQACRGAVGGVATRDQEAWAALRQPGTRTASGEAESTRAVQAERGQDRQTSVLIDGQQVPAPPEWNSWTAAQKVFWLRDRDPSLAARGNVLSDAGKAFKDITWQSQRDLGKSRVDSFIAATGQVPQGRDLFNVAVNPAYRLLDKCTDQVTGFSILECGLATLETVTTGAALASPLKLTTTAGSRAGTLLDDAARQVPTRREAQQLIADGTPVGSALKSDPFHRAPAFVVDDIAERAHVFRILGEDGVERSLVQMPGEVNGVAGRFEWIVDDLGRITHQLFVKGGTITGRPLR